MKRRKYISQCNPKGSMVCCDREIISAFTNVLYSGSYILGSNVSAFEKEFALWSGSRYAVGVANGTDAIELGLRVCGVRPGDAVLTVSLTAVATVAAIRRCGGVPVFVDIEPATLQMDPFDLEKKIRKAGRAPLRAIVPVHLYGVMADMAAIMEIADKNNLMVVEDCAQAHGSMMLYNGKLRKAGTIGHASAFSFYPTKNLGALGDGGAVLLANKKRRQQVMMLRQYGWDSSRVSRAEGVNSRLDEVQAAILRKRLRHLDKENEARCRIAEIYNQQFAGTAVRPLTVSAGCIPAFHQYVVQIKNRSKVMPKLKEAGISTAIHYPLPVHRHPAYKSFGECKLPATEAACKQILSLPLYPDLSQRDAVFIARQLISSV